MVADYYWKKYFLVIYNIYHFIVIAYYLDGGIFLILTYKISKFFWLYEFSSLILKIKFDFINRNILWFLASLIFLFPAFRYSAIWANGHITAFIFFLSSTLFFLRWSKQQNYEKIDLNIILQLIFLALAVYCRQYYALLFFYFMIIKLILNPRSKAG